MASMKVSMTGSKLCVGNDGRSGRYRFGGEPEVEGGCIDSQMFRPPYLQSVWGQFQSCTLGDGGIKQCPTHFHASLVATTILCFQNDHPC